MRRHGGDGVVVVADAVDAVVGCTAGLVFVAIVAADSSFVVVAHAVFEYDSHVLRNVTATVNLRKLWRRRCSLRSLLL